MFNHCVLVHYWYFVKTKIDLGKGKYVKLISGFTKQTEHEATRVVGAAFIVGNVFTMFRFYIQRHS